MGSRFLIFLPRHRSSLSNNADFHSDARASTRSGCLISSVRRKSSASMSRRSASIDRETATHRSVRAPFGSATVRRVGCRSSSSRASTCRSPPSSDGDEQRGWGQKGPRRSRNFAALLRAGLRPNGGGSETTDCAAPVIACLHRHEPAVRRPTDLYDSSVSSADYQTLRD